MPWKAVPKGNKFAVVKKGTGQVVAMHPTMAGAQAQVRAMYANYNKGYSSGDQPTSMDHGGSGASGGSGGPPMNMNKNNTAQQKRLMGAARRRATKKKKSSNPNPFANFNKNKGASSSGATGGLTGPAMNSTGYANFNGK